MSEPIPSSILRLPPDFPANVPPAKLQIGDQVCWQPRPSQDFGIVVGLEYAPAEHLQTWAWRYAVWLSSDSPSRAWLCKGYAWEDDLERQTCFTPHLSSTEHVE